MDGRKEQKREQLRDVKIHCNKFYSNSKKFSIQIWYGGVAAPRRGLPDNTSFEDVKDLDPDEYVVWVNIQTGSMSGGKFYKISMTTNKGAVIQLGK